jgi:hypothetical protein
LHLRTRSRRKCRESAVRLIPGSGRGCAASHAVAGMVLVAFWSHPEAPVTPSWLRSFLACVAGRRWPHKRLIWLASMVAVSRVYGVEVATGNLFDLIGAVLCLANYWILRGSLHRAVKRAEEERPPYRGRRIQPLCHLSGERTPRRGWRFIAGATGRCLPSFAGRFLQSSSGG